MTNLFKRTVYLTKSYLRKDWGILCGALVSIVALVLAVAAAFPAVFDSKSSRIAMIETIKQPAMRAIIGIYHGDTSMGSFFTSIMIIWTAILAIIFAILITIRNTRAQEESNLSELLLSKSIGRLALPMASFLEQFVLFFAIFLINVIGLYGLNINGLSLESAILFSASVSLVGMVFSSLTILFAQLASTTSGTNILSFTSFLIAYLFVIIGSQAHKNTLLWFSPLGWLSKISLTDKNYYGPIWLMVIISLILLGIALFLQLNRDLGAGLLPTSKGKDHASKALAGFSTLAIKNQITSSLVWIGVLFVAGLAYGSVFKDIGKIAASNPILMKIIAQQKDLMIINFSFMILGIFAIISLVPGILHVYRIKSDETKGYLELVHSKKTSRTKIFTTYLGIGVVDSFLTFISGALGIFVAQNSNLPDPISGAHFMNATIAFLPIILAIIGVSALIVTFAPKLVNIIWLVLYYSFFINYFGKLFKMPKWAMNLSPFNLIKKSWNTPLSTSYIVIFLIVAAVLTGISFYKYHKRDLIY